MDGVHMLESSGYCILAVDAPIQHRGGVAVLYYPSYFFQVEAYQVHGPNIDIFHLESGGQIWLFVGCYLAPDNTLTIERIVEATS